ncbi:MULTISPECIES: triose-phosphate isomerase [unclassified Marinobacter]|uniref:triose-phosphate isomerase n=1 Tax=unclassified Marinobacter TaxID=83889 RepID=UPI000BF4D626|nr:MULTISPECIES: triose-phosphate isomerase [unclassified Marinobacter]PFG55002.1 triosephosphate isomerase [Marinobacter sp. LV10R520-4]
MRKPILIGNWKMNGSLQSNQALITRLLPRLRPLRKVVDIAVCPPLPYLFQVRDLLGYTGITLGAQNASGFVSGAHTGESSATMLKEMGCVYVLVGHSERRSLYGETDADADVAERFAAVRGLGMTPVLCVGESLQDRESGRTAEVVQAQIQAVINKVGLAGLAEGVLAYEPVWAIGTGKTATPEQVAETHFGIRQFIAGCGEPKAKVISQALRILYGGSVKPANAVAIFSLDDVDGGLIGGASLHADDFAAIAEALGATYPEAAGESESH